MHLLVELCIGQRHEGHVLQRRVVEVEHGERGVLQVGHVGVRHARRAVQHHGHVERARGLTAEALARRPAHRAGRALVDAEHRREEVGHEVRRAHDDRVAEVAGPRVARVERAPTPGVPPVDPSAAAVGTARELDVEAVGAAVALGVGDRAPERDVERRAGQLRGVRDRDAACGGLGVRRGVAALRRKLAGPREGAEVDRGLQHLALVAQAGQVDREGHRPHQHHDQQRRDDHHGPALVAAGAP